MGPRNYTKGSRSYKQMDGLSYKIKVHGRSKIFDWEALKLLVRRSSTVGSGGRARRAFAARVQPGWEVEGGRGKRWRRTWTETVPKTNLDRTKTKEWTAFFDVHFCKKKLKIGTGLFLGFSKVLLKMIRNQKIMPKTNPDPDQNKKKNQRKMSKVHVRRLHPE